MRVCACVCVRVTIAYGRLLVLRSRLCVCVCVRMCVLGHEERMDLEGCVA